LTYESEGNNPQTIQQRIECCGHIQNHIKDFQYTHDDDCPIPEMLRWLKEINAQNTVR